MNAICFSEAEISAISQGIERYCGRLKDLSDAGESKLCWLLPQKAILVQPIQRLEFINIRQQVNQPRMLRSGPAAQLISCTSRKVPSIYQIAIYIFFIIQNWVYEWQIAQLLQPSIITLVLQLWRYVLIGFLFYQVLQVTNSDTRDPLLQNPQNEDQYDPNDLIYCFMCNAIVLKSSYHCWRCNQCSHLLDHHCKYLNCCIAQANYFPFLRLLSIFICYSTDFIALIYIRKSQYRLVWWILVISVIQLLLAIGLFGFHLYLAWCYNGSTLNFYNKKNAHKSKPIELQEQTHIFT